MTMRLMILILLALTLTGCKLFDGYGTDGSELVIDHRCEVDLKQRARAAGADDADMMEKVQVNPDCTTVIDFRQTVGDSVKDIEQPAAAPVEAPAAEAPQGETNGN